MRYLNFNHDFSWAMVQRGGQLVVGYFFSLLLARLLGPDEFGIVALALVWLGFFRVIGDIGFSSAVIQSASITSAQLSSIFFLNLVLSVLLLALSVASVRLASPVTDVPELPLVVSALSVSLLLSGLSVTQQAIAYRNLSFRFLALRDIWSVVAGGIAGVSAALIGLGFWALVIQALVTPLVSTVFLWSVPKWSPRFSEFSFSEVRPLLGFSIWILLFQIFGYAVREIDKIFIGTIAGVTVLGYYGLAVKLIFQPAVHFSGALGKYLFPKISSMQNSNADIRQIYSASISLALAYVFPLLLVLGLLLYSYATLLLGLQWANAVPLLPYVALSAACQSLISPAGPVMKATNRPALLLGWAVLFTALVVVGCLFGLRHGGIVQAAIGISIAYLLGMVLISLLMRKILGAGSSRLFLIVLVMVIGIMYALIAHTGVTGLQREYKWLGVPMIFFVGFIYWKTIALFKQLDYSHFISRA